MANPKRDTGQKKVKSVVRNRHGNDKEVVFDDGEQVLNDESRTEAISKKSFQARIEESLTTGAIAIAPTTSLKGKSTMANPKHKMKQPGTPIGGRKTSKDATVSDSGDMTEHGDPFGKKQKNAGGQFEKLEGAKHEGIMGEEHLTRSQIADSIEDDGVQLQNLFDSYAHGVQYVSLGEFREISEAYGCNCPDEGTLLRLMQTNQNFMFIEGQDGGGRFWVPQMIVSEGGVPEAFKKNWSNQGDDDGEGGKKKKPKSKKPWEKDEEGDSSVDEGFQRQSPEEHFGRHKDPRYDQAKSMDDIDFFGDDEVTDPAGGMGGEDEFGGGMGDDGDMGGDEGADAIGGSPMRGGDAFAGREQGDMGAGNCPQCRAPMDELGCPECGFTQDEFEQNRFDDPGAVAGNRDDLENIFGGMGGGVPGGVGDIEGAAGEDLNDAHGMGDEYADEFDDEFYEAFERGPNREIMEDGSKHKMESPKGKGVESKTTKKSGFPQEKADTTEMGKEWPRKQKNTGGMWEEFGDSKHSEASDGFQKHHADLNLKTKQKNTGGQWEQFEGGQHDGKMGGGASKMYESVNALNRHVRLILAREAKTNRRLYNESGKYPVTFVVSATDQVKPRMHSHLMEALADAEELIQVYGPDQVSFEARFCDGDGAVVAKKLVPMIGVYARGPIVAENRILFRFPEIARDYADLVVSEGKTCRAVTDNWGASVTAALNFRQATQIYRGLIESARG